MSDGKFEGRKAGNFFNIRLGQFAGKRVIDRGEGHAVVWAVRGECETRF